MLEILLVASLLGLIPGLIARSKGHDFFIWWLYGALLFIFALPHSLLAGQDRKGLERRAIADGGKKCLHCAEIIKREATACRFCGQSQQQQTVLAAQPSAGFCQHCGRASAGGPYCQGCGKEQPKVIAG